MPCSASLLAEAINRSILTAAVRAQHMTSTVESLLDENEERLELLGSCIFRASEEDATVVKLVIDKVD